MDKFYLKYREYDKKFIFYSLKIAMLIMVSTGLKAQCYQEKLTGLSFGTNIPLTGFPGVTYNLTYTFGTPTSMNSDSSACLFKWGTSCNTTDLQLLKFFSDTTANNIQLTFSSPIRTNKLAVLYHDYSDSNTFSYISSGALINGTFTDYAGAPLLSTYFLGWPFLGWRVVRNTSAVNSSGIMYSADTTYISSIEISTSGNAVGDSIYIGFGVRVPSSVTYSNNVLTAVVDSFCSDTSLNLVGTSPTITPLDTPYYVWQKSTTSATSGFVDISSSNTKNLNTGVLTTTTWYRRIVYTPFACIRDTSNVIKVFIKSKPVLTLSSNSPICSGQNISITSSSTLTGTTYSWSGPNSYSSTSQNVSITAATTVNSGTYSVTPTANGCVGAVSTISMNVIPVPSAPTVNSNSPVCTGDTIKLTGSTTPSGGTYSWTGPNGFTSGSQNPNILNAATAMSGNYSLKHIFLGCSSPTSTVNVVVNQRPSTPAIGGNTPVCSGDSIMLTSSAGLLGTTYSWTGPNGFTSSLQNPTIYNSTTSMTGTYSITHTATGCTSPANTISISVLQRPTTPTVGSNSPICSGDSIKLTSSTAPVGGVYSWTGPNGFTSSAQNPIIANATTTMNGNYSLTHTANGCTSTVSTVNIVVNQRPSTPAISGNTPVCSGDSIKLTTSSGLTGTIYSWTGPNGFVSSLQNPSISSSSTAMSGVYSVSHSLSGCLSPSNTINITVYQRPSAPVVSGNSPICSGDSIKLTSSTAPVGATYSWTGPNGFISSLQNPIITSSTTAMSGTYTLTHTANGCISTPSSVSILVNQRPSTPTVNGNSPVCSGDSIKLMSSTAPVGATYSWTGPNGFVSSLQNPTIATSTTTMSGNYTLTHTANGCTSPSNFVNITVYQRPSTPAVSGNSPVCSGDSIKLTSSAAPVGATYSWTGPNGFVSSLQNPTIANSTTAMSGNYILTHTSNGCISSSSSVSILVNQRPSVPTVNGNSPVCSGDSIKLTSSTAPVGATYSWTGPNGFASSLQNPIITNASTIMSGNYIVTHTMNSCTSTASTVNIVVNQRPFAPVISSNSPVCSGDTVKLMSNAAPTGGLYSWSGPNTFSSIVQNPLLLNSTTSMSGTYTLMHSLNGCISTPSTVSVLVNQRPAIPTISSNSPLCSGDSIKLTSSSAPSGGTYSWTGANGFVSSVQNPIITNATTFMSGTYALTHTLNGCISSSNSLSVTVNQRPSAPTITGNSPLCSGDSIKLTSSSAPVGGTYSWTGPNSYTSSVQNPIIVNSTVSMTGTYTLTHSVTGCTSPASTLSLTVNLRPTTPPINGTTPVCSGDTIKLSTTTTPIGGTYNWTGPNGFTSGVQNPNILNATTAMSGTYVISHSLNGCTSPTSFMNIVVNQRPSAPVLSSNSPICSDDTVKLMSSVAPSGSMYSWTGVGGFVSSVQNPIILNATTAMSGTYNLTHTILGCTSTMSTINIVVNQRPSMPSVTANSPVCSGDTIKLTSTTAPIGSTYSWTGPNGFTSSLQNPIITNATTAMSGNYSVTHSLNGCVSSAGIVSVVVNQTPSTPVVSSNSPVCSGDSIKLTSSVAPTGGTYTWTGANSFTSTVQNPTIASSTTAMSGNYSVKHTNNGCSSALASVNVVVNQTPSAPVVSSNSPVCSGDTIKLTSSIAPTGGAYSWTGANGFTSTVQNPIITSSTTAMSGNYSVTHSKSGCTSSASIVNVVVNQTPSTPVIGSNTPICSGDSIKLSSSAAPTGGTYTWTGANSFTSTVQNPTIPNSTTAMSGNYSVKHTNNGCNSAIVSVNVVVHQTPSTPVVSSNSPVCSGDTIKLTSSVAPTGSTYSWIGSNSFTSSVQNPTIASSTTAMSGNYSVTHSVNGCTSAIGTVNVIVNQTPSIPTITSNSPVCSGDSIKLTSSIVPSGGTYSWVGANGFTSTDQDPNIPNSTTAMLGNYTVTHSVNGCHSSSNSINVVVHQTPSIPILSGNSPVCSGNTISLTSNAAPTGGTYSWTGANGFTSSVQNPSITNATTAMSGYYVLSHTVNGCMGAKDSINIVVNQTPSIPTIGSNSPICSGDSIKLTSSVAPTGGTYSWTGVNGFTSSDQNPTIANSVTSMSGNYSVSHTANGCTSLTNVITVTVNQTPLSPVVSSNSPVCTGDTIKLNSSAGTTGVIYAWSGANAFSSDSQNPIIINATTAMSGTYDVIHMVNGCASPVSSISIVVNQTPAAPVINSNSPICSGDTIKLMSNPISSTGLYAWTGANGFLSADQNPEIPNATTAMSGNYQLTHTENGCTSPPTLIKVAVNQTPSKPIIGSNSPVCSGDFIKLTSSVGIAGVVYSWTGPNGFTSTLQNPTIANSFTGMSGNYTLKHTALGCISETVTQALVVNQTPTAPTVSNNSPICETNQVKLFANGLVGAKFSWEGPNGYTDTAQYPVRDNATANMSGRYYVVQIVNNCPSSKAFTDYNVKIKPEKPVIGTNSPVCVGDTLDLIGTKIMDSAVFIWGGANNFSSSSKENFIPNTTKSMNGTYFLTQNLNGCISDSTFLTVRILEKPNPPQVETPLLVQAGDSLVLRAQGVVDTATRFTWRGVNNFTSTENTPVLLNADNSLTGKYYVYQKLGACRSDEVSIDVTVLDKLIKVYNSMTPNNDGYLDYLTVRGVNQTTANKMVVYDGASRVVYQASNYQNDWDGKSSDNMPLPEGTYYYYFEYNFDGKSYTEVGFVVIVY